MRIRPSLPVLLLGVLAGLAGPGASGGDSPVATWQAEPGPIPPLHPTVIMGSYQDHRYPVVGISGSVGVVEVKGKSLRLPPSATYEPARANAFALGSIEVKGQEASSSQVRRTVMLSGGGRYDGGVDLEGSRYEARVVASQAYSGCYLVLLFFAQDYLNGQSDDTGASVALQKIGDLPAGVETKVSASFGYIDFKRRSLACVPLFFSHGSEIRSNLSDDSARLFRRIEMLRHKKLVDQYFRKNPRATLPARPYLRFPPVFGPEVDRLKTPAHLKVDYTITSEGTVEGVLFSATLQTEALVGIQRALEGWLFFPRLENGQPVSSLVTTEFDFQSPAPQPGPAAAKAPPRG